MTAAIHDFRSIRRKLERQEQKAEFEEKNPEPSMYGWPYGVACPYTSDGHWKTGQIGHAVPFCNIKI